MPFGARHIDRLWVEVGGLKATVGSGIANFDHVAAVRTSPPAGTPVVCWASTGLVIIANAEIKGAKELIFISTSLQKCAARDALGDRVANEENDVGPGVPASVLSLTIYA